MVPFDISVLYVTQVLDRLSSTAAVSGILILERTRRAGTRTVPCAAQRPFQALER